MANQCPKCGYENRVGATVCVQCAASLARLCENCGFENPANFKFCGNCGANLVSASLARPAGEPARRGLPSAIPAALAEKIAGVGKQIEGERRTVTVLFADISGFTAISEKLDPEQVYEFIDATRKSFIDEIYKHEGHLDKVLGDGVMALFGAPVAHEDDPARALRAALGMQEALKRINVDLEPQLGISLRLRIGLNSGLVVVGSVGSDLQMEYTALGDTVNVASRLQTVAEPGSILVSRSVYEQTQPLFEFRELGSIRVKNRVEPVEIYEVIAPRQKAGRMRGIPGLAAPMVGREEELGRVRQAVESLIEERQGRIVLVTGDAGIGKSRLTAELKAFVADKPVTVLEGACFSYGQSAYGVFLNLLKSYCGITDDDTEDTVRDKIEQTVRRVFADGPSVTEVLPYVENLFSIRIIEKELAERVRHLTPPQLQQQTFLAVRDLLTAETTSQPVILILEDAHWMDKVSLDLLTLLLGAVENFPLLIYCNSRPAEGTAAAQIEKLGKEFYAPHFLHIPLAPLTQADSLALVDLLLTISELPERLKQLIPQRAEGNPFFLEEIIRVLIDRGIIRRAGDRWQVAPEADLARFEVPRTLQGLIMTRIDHLSEGSRQAIHCASVIGRDFLFRLLNVVLNDARSLPDDVHELEERELVNRLIPATDLEYRFHHVLIQETVYNGLLLRRRDYLHRKIAEGIETLFADRLEEHVEQLAFHYAESKNPARALPYQIRAGKRAADRFANDEALRYYQTAAEFLNQTASTREQRVQVYEGLGGVQSFIGDYEDALNSYQIALELVRTSNYPQLHRATPEIMRLIGRVHERRGDYAEALRWLQDALTELERDPESAQSVTRVRVYNDTGWVHYRRGEFEDAYQWRMRALQIVQGTDYYNEMASAYNGLAVLFRYKGDWARALAYTEKGLRLRETIGDSYGVSQSYTNLGLFAAEQCNWDLSLQYFERSLEIKQKTGDVGGTSLLSNNLGWLYREKGDYPRATLLLHKALEIAERIKNGNLTCLALNNLAHVSILQDQADNAVRYLTRCADIATEMGSKENLAEAQWLFAEAYSAQNQLDQAQHCARQAVTLAAQIGAQLIEGAAQRVLARLARAQQHLDAAEDYVQRSLAIFESLKNPFELAKSQYQLALLQRDRGQLSAARATLETAHATFARLGAQAEQQRARAALDALTATLLAPAE